MTDCTAYCAAYNEGYQQSLDAGEAVSGGFCKSVALVRGEGEFCYLKNGIGTNDTTYGGYLPVDTAVLDNDADE